MNRQEAAREIDNTACCFSDKRFRDAMHMAANALRGPVPDPETGLVNCGCGGKAKLGKLQYTISDPDLMPEYYAYCQDCGITTENSADRERVEAAWNRAMGYKGDV